MHIKITLVKDISTNTNSSSSSNSNNKKMISCTINRNGNIENHCTNCGTRCWDNHQFMYGGNDYHDTWWTENKEQLLCQYCVNTGKFKTVRNYVPHADMFSCDRVTLHIKCSYLNDGSAYINDDGKTMAKIDICGICDRSFTKTPYSTHRNPPLEYCRGTLGGIHRTKDYLTEKDTEFCVKCGAYFKIKKWSLDRPFTDQLEWCRSAGWTTCVNHVPRSKLNDKLLDTPVSKLNNNQFNWIFNGFDYDKNAEDVNFTNTPRYMKLWQYYELRPNSEDTTMMTLRDALTKYYYLDVTKKKKLKEEEEEKEKLKINK